jgi:hypothetical protein
MLASTKELTEPMFKYAARAPLNNAPERGAKLAAEIGGHATSHRHPAS